MPLQREKQKGKGNSLAKEQKKKPNGSAASLPGDSRAAPVIYEAGGGAGVAPRWSASKILTQVRGTLMLPDARSFGWWSG